MNKKLLNILSEKAKKYYKNTDKLMGEVASLEEDFVDTEDSLNEYLRDNFVITFTGKDYETSKFTIDELEEFMSLKLSFCFSGETTKIKTSRNRYGERVVTDEELKNKLTEDSYKRFLKWIRGQTCPDGGYFLWDVKWFLNGGDVLD